MQINDVFDLSRYDEAFDFVSKTTGTKIEPLGNKTFKIIELPKPSPEELKKAKAAEIRAERDLRIDAIRWRIERYQTQMAAGLETTDTAEHYKAILLYVQYLRDFPQQDGEWWNAPILTFEEWGAAR